MAPSQEKGPFNVSAEKVAETRGRLMREYEAFRNKSLKSAHTLFLGSMTVMGAAGLMIDIGLTGGAGYVTTVLLAYSGAVNSMVYGHLAIMLKARHDSLPLQAAHVAEEEERQKPSMSMQMPVLSPMPPLLKLAQTFNGKPGDKAQDTLPPPSPPPPGISAAPQPER